MTKDVLLSISGLHQDVTGIEAQGDEPGSEPIEVIVPASYYEKNGKHYVIYDELVEGIPGTIKNKVRILDDQKVEIIKSGITNTHMVFEKDKINMTQYETPYGEMMIGVFTKDIRFEEQDEKITVHVNYALDINGDPVADCNIDIKITVNKRLIICSECVCIIQLSCTPFQSTRVAFWSPLTVFGKCSANVSS